MSVTVIQDLRWGDTGKGKVSEALSQPDVCDDSVRSVGGANAGHVVIKGTRKIALHLLPGGCINPGTNLFLGRGMVTHLGTLNKEIDEVHAAFGSNPLSRLKIAEGNHILFDAHKRADAELERRKGKGAVGTTNSGIGIAYADKSLRVGMRFGHLKQSPDAIKDHYATLLRHWAETYSIGVDSEQQDRDIAELLAARERFDGRIVNTTKHWRERFGAHARILIEGAQGSLLSIDGDGYPYTTSSATTVEGHLQGAGIPLRELTKIIGTLKAYDTRVGNGPFPTEIPGERGAAIQKKGKEEGSTTGRKRKVGWLNMESVAEEAWNESVHEIAVLKGDVLDGQPDVKIAVGTDARGEPIYETLPGWDGSHDVRNFEDLPPHSQHFHQRVEQLAGVPITYIGTGPESSQLIHRKVA